MTRLLRMALTLAIAAIAAIAASGSQRGRAVTRGDNQAECARCADR